MTYLNLSEPLLLKKCSEGDNLAFHELYRRYKKHVLSTVSQRVVDLEDAKDVAQDIFVELWTKKEDLQHIRDFKPYLYVFTRNHVISSHRKKNVQLRNEAFLIDGIERLDYTAEDNIVANELLQQINNIIKVMPETTRNCFHLSKNEGKKNHEIAGMLNISEKTVRNNVSEALKRLRLVLKQSNSEIYLLLFALIALLN